MTEPSDQNVKQAVPFFLTTNMDESLRFYVEGLGFEMTQKWIYEGAVRWCWLPERGRRFDATDLSNR